MGIVFGRPLFYWLVSAIFPRHCLRCGEEGALVCRFCSGVVDFGQLPFAYANPTVRELLRSWKYMGDLTARDILLAKAESAWRNRSIETDAIVAIPLSARRKRDRGFNQAQDIACWISKKTSIPVSHVLQRRESRGYQAKRSKEDRAGAMENSPFLVSGQVTGRILLVDDVWTSGSTIKAASEVLMRAGVEKIIVYTVAQGVNE